MKHIEALVPAGWAMYNGVWIAILAGFGGSAVPLWMYGGAVAIIEAMAAAVFLSASEPRGPKAYYRVPDRAGAAVVAAVGVVLIGLGTSLGPWLYPPGVVTLAWAVAVAL